MVSKQVSSNPGPGGNQAKEQDGRQIHEPDGLQDMLRAQLMQRVPHIGPEGWLAEVIVQAAEPDPQGAGYGCLGVAAIRAGMLVSVPAQDPPGVAIVELQQPG